MRIINYILPRQSGKTTTILKNVKNNDLLIVLNPDIKRRCIEELKKLDKTPTILTPNQCHLNQIVGRRYNNVYIDEYDFIQNKKEIYNLLYNNHIFTGNIITYSTASFLRDKKYFKRIKKND